MRKLIHHIDVLRASLYAAIVYGILGVAFIPFLLLMMLVQPERERLAFGAVMVVFMPLLYAGIGFVSTAFMCFLYNLLSLKLGGIEITLTDPPDVIQPVAGTTGTGYPG